MKIHLVSGFLGGGKTTAIQTACKVLMSEGYSVGVITNDQGIRLVDSGYFASASIPNRQVVDGCFCCNYNALNNNIQSLIETDKPEVIFAESVGSCTDIVATVMKPLQRYRSDVQVTVSTFADALLLKMLCVDKKKLFQDEVAYIYRKQLEEAGMIVVSKTDLISDDDLQLVTSFLDNTFPQKKMVYVNGTSADGIRSWLEALQQESETEQSLSSMQIDYDTYGAGEAMLAWLDEEVEIYSSRDEAAQDAAALADRIYRKINERDLSIGHLKFLVDGTYKISYTATPDTAVLQELTPSSSSQMLVNARIQTTPEELETLIRTAIRETEEEKRCRVVVRSLSSFQPGYPKPTHRMV